MMKPTVGRIIHYYGNGVKDKIVNIGGNEEPYAAIVAAVNKNGTLNLCVFDRIGGTRCVTNIRLVQPGETIPDKGKDYCIWMPYQVHKAKDGDHNSESAEPRPAN